MEQWTNTLPVIHQNILDRLTSFPETNSEESLSYLLAFNIGGTFNIILKWIKEDMTTPPEVLADYVDEFYSFTSLAGRPK